ncbi:MAG: 50S ribosomal protein L35 [Halothiobacillaceae bacterium]|nr:MAG: 50S ribosomal protein L35 [Halothiobacillaceae bacterium]
MPKIRSNSGAAKRFKKTAKGFKRGSAFKRHILTKKSSKTKRQLGGPTYVHESDAKGIARLLPYA